MTFTDIHLFVFRQSNITVEEPGRRVMHVMTSHSELPMPFMAWWYTMSKLFSRRIHHKFTSYKHIRGQEKKVSET